MQQKTIFISHSTANDAQTNLIAEALKDAGFAVWVDHLNGIEPGTPSWDKAIRQAIDVADAGIFLMTEASLASEICGSECLLIRALGAALYVVKLEDVKPANVWLYIMQIQYADLTKDYDAGIESLISALNGRPTENSPQALRSKFTGESTLRQYLPYLFVNPMRGRDDDLRRLKESLNGAVVQVTGTGGLGKSRLVAEVALNHTEGAVWYRCSTLSSPADLLGLLMEHLRLPKDSTELEMLNQLRLRPKTLVVIDNAEDVVPAHQSAYLSFIAKLQAAGAHVVLTSRKRWEKLRPPKEITPTALDLASAAAIACDFANTQNIPLTPAQTEAIALAARFYPSLIEWAVGQIGKRPFAIVHAQLKDLKSKGVQEALDEMIRDSVAKMTAQEGDYAERLLLRLAVCQGTFTYEVVDTLKPDSLDDDNLDDALDALQAWRFVRYERSEERYSVDPMVWLTLPLPDDDTCRVHFAYYHGRYSDHDTNNNEDTHSSLALDWEDVQAALNWAFLYETEKAVDWLTALQHFMQLRRTNLERFDLLSRALKTAVDTDYKSGEANCLRALGNVHLRKNEYAAAVERYEEALPLYRAIGDRLGEANCLKALGDVHRMKNEYAAAVERYEEVLPLYRAIGDSLGEAHCLKALGDVHYMRDEYAAAVERYQEAMPLYRAIGARLGEAHCLRALGDVHRMKNEYAAAVERYEEVLPLYRAIGDRLGEANCLRALGDVLLMKNEYTAAVERYQEALPLYLAIGDRLGEANCLNALGDVHYMRGEYAAAVERYQEALPLYLAIGDRLGEADCLRALGHVHYMREEYAAAVERYEEALPLYRAIGARLGEANCLRALGDVDRMKNEYTAAVERYQEALPLYLAIGDSLGEANCLKALGDVHYMRDEYAAAVERYQEAMPLYRALGARLGEAHCLTALGDVDRMKNEYAAAVERYEEALPLYRAIGARLGEADCLKALGDVHYMRDENAATVERYQEALALYRALGARLGEADCLKALGDEHYMRDEYAAAVERYQEALEIGKALCDFTSQLNSLKGLALTYHAQNDSANARQFAKVLLELAQSHPFFKSHPSVQGWREKFASWGYEGI